jgi:hypothetical protein
MKDQELKDLFHAYRPELADKDAFMQRLSAQMDAADGKQQPARTVPLYRKLLPWAAAVAAAVVIAWLAIPSPTPMPAPQTQSCLPEYSRPTPHFSHASFDDIVNEIEASGRQLEQAIAQL